MIARILRPQGRRGELLAEILTDFPERFAQRRQLWIVAEGSDARREFTLEDHWFHKGCAVLKFVGIDSISDAEVLKGMLVQIPGESRAELEAGAFYIDDLVGSTVIDLSSGQRREIGLVEDVKQGVGAAPLLVVRNSGEEYEIPFAEQYIVNFDVARKTLEMKLPAGLLEVNAPLSDSEKRKKR